MPEVPTVGVKNAGSAHCRLPKGFADSFTWFGFLAYQACGKVNELLTIFWRCCSFRLFVAKVLTRRTNATNSPVVANTTMIVVPLTPLMHGFL